MAERLKCQIGNTWMALWMALTAYPPEYNHLTFIRKGEKRKQIFYIPLELEWIKRQKNAKKGRRIKITLWVAFVSGRQRPQTEWLTDRIIAIKCLKCVFPVSCTLREDRRILAGSFRTILIKTCWIFKCCVSITIAGWSGPALNEAFCF